MNKLEEKSLSKIEESQKKDLDFIKLKIKDSNPTLYDQLLISSEERKYYFYTEYTAESLSRVVKEYKFPLLPSVNSDFRSTFLTKKSSIQKIENVEIFESIERLGVYSNLVPSLNNEKLVYYDEIPLELNKGKVISNQPYYYIPELTKSETCHQCNGEKYTTCEDKECQGQHVYTCSDCRGQGEISCGKCDGRHEYRCPSCQGKGELKCTRCRGIGNVQCDNCNGKGYRNINGRDEKCLRCRGGQKTCNECKGTGSRKCSSLSGHGLIGAVIKKGVGHEYCGGKGVITCKVCKPNGKIDCERCHTSGDITCEICYGDQIDNRCGKIDCKTCKTTGEIGTLSFIESKIDYHRDKTINCTNAHIRTDKFSINNIKKFIQASEPLEVYRNINNDEEIKYDQYSKDLSQVIEKKLGISKTSYPKLLVENLFYECVPCTTVTYSHILSGTEHKVSLIGIDTDEPEVIFHSDPTKIDSKKGLEKNVFKDLTGRAFTTKTYKQKIEKRNEIILMVHIAKANGLIEDSEKQVLAKYITSLDNFTNKEKQELFDLMSTSELPELKEDRAIFYSEESILKAIDKMTELATNADGTFEEAEKVKIQELKEFILHASASKKGRLANFFGTWQISIPILVTLSSIIFTCIWFLFLSPIETNPKNQLVTENNSILPIKTELADTIEKYTTNDPKTETSVIENKIEYGIVEAQFSYIEFGDFYYFVFTDNNGKEWDFGKGENNLEDYDFGEEGSNPELVGQKFKINWKKEVVTSTDMNGNNENKYDILSIVSIERINNNTISKYKINDPDGFSNLRDKPNGQVLQKIYDNETFEVVGEVDDWKKVKLSNGILGFIHTSRVVLINE